MTSKTVEADEWIKKAEKSMKTSFLKWSPDSDSAIEFYGKAALIYRNMKMNKESAELYVNIAKLYLDKQSFFHCAKSYDTASLLYREMGDFTKMVECIETAGKLLRQNGVPDTATSLYEKGARSLESKIPEKAAAFYEKAADTSELEEKYLQAAHNAGQSARMWTSLKRFDEADRLLHYQMQLCSQAAAVGDPQMAYQVCGKAVVALVVIKLYREDSIAASKIYSEAVEKFHFNETDDAGPVARLLQVYEALDAEAAAKVIKLSTFQTLETEFGRLARSIQFPSAEGFGDSTTMMKTAKAEEEEGGDDADIC